MSLGSQCSNLYRASENFHNCTPNQGNCSSSHCKFSKPQKNCLLWTKFLSVWYIPFFWISYFSCIAEWSLLSSALLLLCEELSLLCRIRGDVATGQAGNDKKKKTSQQVESHPFCSSHGVTLPSGDCWLAGNVCWSCEKLRVWDDMNRREKSSFL